jgi:hypothetical protein
MKPPELAPGRIRTRGDATASCLAGVQAILYQQQLLVPRERQAVTT